MKKQNPTVMLLSTNSDRAGAPMHVLLIIKLLRRKVNFVAVFGEEGPVAEEARSLEVPVEIVPEMRSSINPNLDIAAFHRISGCVSQYMPDIIHAHSSKAGMLGRLIAFKYKIPCVYTVHGWGWRGLGIVKAVAVFIIEKLLSFTPRLSLIYVSQSVEIDARGKLGLPKKLGTVIHNGVDDVLSNSPHPSPTSNILRILMPARVCDAKDHNAIISAFERLEFPCELYLCGAGTNHDFFIQKARHWAPTSYQRIFFLGPRSDVPNLLLNTDVFALISNFEALPISVIEAMSAGKAIIASDVGGLRELIDNGKSGLLVPRNDIDAIVNSLRKFADIANRSSYGLAARDKYLSKFTAQIMIKKLFDHYLSSIKCGSV